MKKITEDIIKSLRDTTGKPMVHCKLALVAADGDVDKAIHILSLGYGYSKLNDMAEKARLYNTIDNLQDQITYLERTANSLERELRDVKFDVVHGVWQ